MLKADDKNEIIKHLNNAIKAFEKGVSLFENKDFQQFPDGKKDQILAYCKECSRNMNSAAKLDTTYTKVYQHFSDGGNESGCRIAKNRWCFAKIEFARARIKSLSSND